MVTREKNCRIVAHLSSWQFFLGTSNRNHQMVSSSITGLILVASRQTEVAEAVGNELVRRRECQKEEEHTLD